MGCKSASATTAVTACVAAILLYHFFARNRKIPTKGLVARFVAARTVTTGTGTRQKRTYNYPEKIEIRLYPFVWVELAREYRQYVNATSTGFKEGSPDVQINNNQMLVGLRAAFGLAFAALTFWGAEESMQACKKQLDSTVASTKRALYPANPDRRLAPSSIDYRV